VLRAAAPEETTPPRRPSEYDVKWGACASSLGGRRKPAEG
jgi:hypothetical protein